MSGLGRMATGVAMLLAVSVLGGCGGGYGPVSAFGGRGYSERQLDAETWRIRMQADKWMNWPTLRSYWLQRATEIALAQGVDGFQVMTDVTLTESPADRAVQVASLMIFFIPSEPTTNYALLEGDIRLLRHPIRTVPYKVFDARRLLRALEPHIRNSPCGGVCPHTAEYISNP